MTRHTPAPDTVGRRGGSGDDAETAEGRGPGPGLAPGGIRLCQNCIILSHSAAFSFLSLFFFVLQQESGRADAESLLHRKCRGLWGRLQHQTHCGGDIRTSICGVFLLGEQKDAAVKMSRVDRETRDSQQQRATA